jgi:hypothetical protein
VRLGADSKGHAFMSDRLRVHSNDHNCPYCPQTKTQQRDNPGFVRMLSAAAAQEWKADLERLEKERSEIANLNDAGVPLPPAPSSWDLARCDMLLRARGLNPADKDPVTGRKRTVPMKRAFLTLFASVWVLLDEVAVDSLSDDDVSEHLRIRAHAVEGTPGALRDKLKYIVRIDISRVLLTAFVEDAATMLGPNATYTEDDLESRVFCIMQHSAIAGGRTILWFSYLPRKTRRRAGPDPQEVCHHYGTTYTRVFVHPSDRRVNFFTTLKRRRPGCAVKFQRLRSKDIYVDCRKKLFPLLYPSTYEHYVLASHAEHYMRQLGSLRRYSQEACESFIGLMQNYFRIGTNRGGGRAGSDGSSIARAFKLLFVRRLALQGGLLDVTQELMDSVSEVASLATAFHGDFDDDDVAVDVDVDDMLSYDVDDE